MEHASFGLHDAIGLLGVAIILGLYWALQADRLSRTSPIFSLGNALGAGLIVVSLCFDFNWAAMVIEVSWVCISLWGYWRHSRNVDAQPQP